jgi:hypothetical protein
MEAQLQQAIDTFRFQMGLLVQVWGFLIAADAILVGYSVTQKKGVLLLIASVMPVLMFLASRAILAHGLPFLYIAIYLERRLMPSSETLTASYARMKFPMLYRRVAGALAIDDIEDRDKAILGSQLTSRRVSRGMPGVFFAGWLGHMALLVLSLTIFGYTFM